MGTTAKEWKELFDRLNKEGEVNKLFLGNPKNKGITAHLVNIYPENAHFIYELLQNAEDVAAKNCWLYLYEDRLEFSHDGSPFTPENVDAITGINFSDKGEGTGKIGKFGVGFKSVFAYTNSPQITSGLISFAITDLVLPQLTTVNHIDVPITRFVFPFNNPKKPREKAYLEIKKGLDELDGKCILFLNNIQKIEIKVQGALLKKIRRETPTRANAYKINQTITIPNIRYSILLSAFFFLSSCF